MIMERKKIKANHKNGDRIENEIESLLHGWKKHKKFLLYLGILFGFGRIFFFIGFELAGAINGSLAEKTRIIYGGSVNFKNARNYIKEAQFQGFIIGGASLNPKEFVNIIKSVS